MASKYPHLRQAPEGTFRIIEIDWWRQAYAQIFCWRVSGTIDELRFTVIVGDYPSWDEALGVLKQLTHKQCRRMLWDSRGNCLGSNNYGVVSHMSRPF